MPMSPRQMAEYRDRSNVINGTYLGEIMHNEIYVQNIFISVLNTDLESYTMSIHTKIRHRS